MYAAQHPDPEMGEPVGAGISRPEREPGYGVPREQCHVGCGYICRRPNTCPQGHEPENVRGACCGQRADRNCFACPAA